MSFPLFLRGFVIAMIVFAIANYVLTQSVWTTFINTLLCGVLIQLGYFLAILVMVWRSPASGKQGDSTSAGKSAVAEASQKERKSGTPLPGVGRSRLP